MGLPVLSTDVTGCKDAVSHGFNGTLVQRGNVIQLATQITDYMRSPELRRKHGNNGVEWAGRFKPERIWAGIEKVYMEDRGEMECPSLGSGFRSGVTRALFIATSDIHLHVFHGPHIKWLCANGFSVDIAAETRRGYRIGENGEWHELKFARELTSVSHLFTLRKLRNVIRRGQYDLISCHTPIPGALARLAVAGIPRKKRPRVVYMAHGFHFSRKGSLWNWLAYYPAEVALSRLTNALVVINQEDLDHASSPRFRSSAYLVPGIGVDTNRFHPVTEERRRKVRQELGFEENDFVIMYIGEFIQRKNHQFILACAQELSRTCPNIKIVFVGKGRLGNRLRRIVKRQGLQQIVHFAGFREDVERYAAISDVGISSSRREGLGLGLAEQMACALPAVASCDKGHRELVEDGVNGFLFPQGDRASFINAIERLHDSPGLRHRMGKHSRRKALDFSIEASVEAMGNVYREALRRGPRASPARESARVE
jgi:glycosyltransferase EpsD